MFRKKKNFVQNNHQEKLKPKMDAKTETQNGKRNCAHPWYPCGNSVPNVKRFCKDIGERIPANGHIVAKFVDDHFRLIII